MSDNRYAPPTAPVQDIAPVQMGPRPRQVVLAVQLAAAGYLLGLVTTAMTWDYYARLQPVGRTIATQVLGLIVFVWLYYKIYIGRNWARITLLVFSILGCLGAVGVLFTNILAALPPLAKARTVLGVGINLVVLWLLFLTPGREWFKRHEA
jgi:hypothetical protein